MNNSSSVFELFIMLLLGVGVGVGLGEFIGNSDPASLRYQAKAALDKCEATLPRNQHCVVIAVPKKGESR